MTQLIYEPVTFITNGDGSEFHIVFPEDWDDESIDECRQKLIKNGFPIHTPPIPYRKSITLSVRAMRKLNE